ncbi:MAG: 16S rRNA (uracil(1498)-N(3))-methyltransferase [Phycisphaerales bacterium]|nr:16S rRNA (uracil(1498)-N(3))-methyltransferase [Phycisphaerales bacterium]MCB9855883.1 16S rRNA (uracil(1498)-N(3))-methyltransferase [Phycisphaerales bacterium]
MRERRFPVESLQSPRVVLTGRERHHAVDVLRLPIGAIVTLFDGKGQEAQACVIEMSSERIIFELTETPRSAGVSGLLLTLAVAAPKGARGDWLVEKCAEFGVSRLVLIDTQRGEVRPGDGKLERWRRKAVEAAKQSGSAGVMQIEAGASIEQVFREGVPGSRAVYGATDGAAIGLYSCLVEAMSAEAPACICVIGPEGGLTPAEIETLKTLGARPVSLGRSTLRVETAAIAAAAIWAGAVSSSSQ